MNEFPQSADRRPPEWLIAAPYEDTDLGVLRTGKEAQINLIERTSLTAHTATSILLAEKRYMPRNVKNKGELEAMGVQKASTFRNDAMYREGRQFRKTRDRTNVGPRQALDASSLDEPRARGHGDSLAQRSSLPVSGELWRRRLLDGVDRRPRRCGSAPGQSSP